jgi:hypothetical protein
MTAAIAVEARQHFDTLSDRAKGFYAERKRILVN